MAEIIHTKFTKDDIIAQQVMQTSQLHTPEMLAKNMIYTEDINDSYTNNICTFQLQAISNSNHAVDIKNSYLILPMLGHLVTTEPISIEQARQSMIMKSSIAAIHNVDIELSNMQVQEPINNISMYKNFIDHTTGSVDKDEWNDGLKIYHKMTGDAWFFDTEGGLRQDKISFDGISEKYGGMAIYNKGVKSNLRFAHPDKAPILDQDTLSKYKQPRFEIITDKDFYYHHYCIIRLGDLSSFCEQLPLITGPYFQMKIRLNQVSNYKVTVKPDSIRTKSHNMSNDFCPFFRASTLSDTHQEYTQDLVTKAYSVGSVNATNDFTYELKLGKIAGKSHDMGRPRWVMASYSLSESLDSQLLANPVRTLNYKELIHSQYLDQDGYFSLNLASSTRDIERLIIIPVLSASSNGTHTGGIKVNGLNSCTHGLNTSPINIDNLRLNVSGRPLYIQPLTFSYEQFLQEMHDVNGSKSTNGSISLSDFENVYHYFVFDLSRGSVEDIGAKASYELSGTINGPLHYDFYIFFEQKKHISVDLTTAQIM